MKMYILVLDTVPNEFVPVESAHSSLACYLKYKDDTDMIQWVTNDFDKVVCKVNIKEFEIAKKNYDKYVILTESRLNDDTVSIAFCPTKEYHKCFKFFKMWRV